MFCSRLGRSTNSDRILFHGGGEGVREPALKQQMKTAKPQTSRVVFLQRPACLEFLLKSGDSGISCPVSRPRFRRHNTRLKNRDQLLRLVLRRYQRIVAAELMLVRHCASSPRTRNDYARRFECWRIQHSSADKRAQQDSAINLRSPRSSFPLVGYLPPPSGKV